MTSWIIIAGAVIVIILSYAHVRRCWKAFVRSHYWNHVGENGPIPEPEKCRFIRRLGRRLAAISTIHSAGG